MKFHILLLSLVLLAGSAFAADVDGKWSGTLATPNGDATMVLTLKADGTALSGSTSGPDGSDIKIADGKIDGANVSFSVTFDFGGMGITINYKGVVSKDSIKFTLDVMGMPMDLVVKKST